ncbi:TE1, partial [Symbiodinium sp. KB8]
MNNSKFEHMSCAESTGLFDGCSKTKEKYFRAVRRLFTTLDQNSDGGITKNEFEQAWDNPVLQTVFDALEI